MLAVENIPTAISLLRNSSTAAVRKSQLPIGSFVGH